MSAFLRLAHGLHSIPIAPSGPDYNPLNLPAYTVRVKFAAGENPSSWGGISASRVSENPNIWDLTKVDDPTNWEYLLGTGSEGVVNGVLEILGANSTGVTSMRGFLGNCVNLTSVALFDVSSVTDMSFMLSGCTNVQSGALALYQQASTQANVPLHDNCFYDCGSGTVTGAAELAQIPSEWK